MAKLTPDEQGLMNKFLDTKVMVVMGVSVLISAFIFAMGVRRVTLSPTRFNLGVVACTVTFLVNDLMYWIVVSLNWFPNLFEIVRILSPIIAGGQVAGLCFERFKVFGNTSHARWYTAPVRRTLLGINYGIMVIGLGLLTSTFIGLDLSRRIPFHPWRKIIIITSAGFTVLSDFTLTVLIFRIVLQIHQALDPLTSSNGLSGSNQQVPSMTPSTDLRRRRPWRWWGGICEWDCGDGRRGIGIQTRCVQHICSRWWRHSFRGRRNRRSHAQARHGRGARKLY
ncbi:hypothetical protein BCR44DRAFT_1231466 [Catenaria anguillulae PL171]|uniref:Uncharacterized protein n=1 Tax=Catenaria anguillulae PL171 TaxID=765915 RepID=A0A1Y2HDR4_9FUNG|nr:hypothetical protein BCR44DRAFT_1231466 [Catenaria anguillulae PL171]